MAGWTVHSPDESNQFLRYRCGLIAGQIVALKKDLVVRGQHGKPTGVVHPRGERWQVQAGIKSDPVLWLKRPNGEQCTWNDDASEVAEWFEVVTDQTSL